MIGLATEAYWTPGATQPAFAPAELVQASQRIRESALILRDRDSSRHGVGFGGSTGQGAPERFALAATLPALYPEWLGDRSFAEAHGVRFPYVVGEMATGISTTQMVIAIARAGMLGFFGAGGLPSATIEAAIDEIEAALGPQGLPWGTNLIHDMQDSAAEDAVADLYLRRAVRRVCASAFLRLTPAVVRYACTGLHVDPSGRIVRPNRLLAKLSRPEVALQFLSPAPPAILAALLERGQLTAREAELALHVPLAEDVTVEADSGGHTDNRPLTALFPTILGLARQVEARYGYPMPIRVGAAGGLGTPSAVAAAFGLGASYVVTGSVNQAAVESGLSPAGRALLAQAALDDVAMAPAADMFELGVKVQVLKRGTMFSVRAHRLYDLYRAHASLDEIPAVERDKLEKTLFRAPVDEIWRETHAFFERRNPAENERAARDPKHKMALVFRWYLGQASRWAMSGVPDRVMDYQIWCGPAMGAFNAWTRDSVLAEPEARTVVQIARNLLEGAAVVTRAQQFRSYGVAVPAAAFDFRPRFME